MPVDIKVVGTEKELKKFIRFPFELYHNNPYWVPPLFRNEWKSLYWNGNPSFEHSDVRYWLAYKDGLVVGRIAGIISHLYNDKWNKKYARFGWIDFIDDKEVVDRLMAATEAWAAGKGMTDLHGPLGFNEMDTAGMLVEGFEEMATLATVYSYPYYPEHMERLNYVKDTDWVEYELKVPDKPNETVRRVAEIALKRNKLHLLNASSRKELLPYAKQIFEIINEAYEPLYGFVPITEQQVELYVDKYFKFIKPEFVPVVLDESGRMAAFGITMPSLSVAFQKSKGRLFPFGFYYILKAMKRNDRADLYLVAVRPELQGKGVNAILMHEMNQVFNRLGIEKVESNPELEANRKVQSQWKFYESRHHKTRRCYIKHLQ
ncbi:hypothetical protein BVY01_00380 [bacterium I07]|nr:hypothetical protein BVY01_00380 [bacterium I07]